MTAYRMWLIQRGDFKERKEKSGIDSIITWDYMGSTEFEYGALSKAYMYILENFSDYNIYIEDDMANANGVPLCIFCKKDEYKVVKATLDAYRKKPYKLKEYISFKREYKAPYIHPVPEYDAIHEHFWFDIEHHFMWFFGVQDRVNTFIDTLIDDFLENELKEGKDNE